MEVAEVGAPGGKKVTHSFLRTAKSSFFCLSLICLAYVSQQLDLPWNQRGSIFGDCVC